MDEQTAAEISAFFKNSRIQTGLSRLGLFAIDFVGKRAFPSSVWLKCGYSIEDMVLNLLPDLLHPEDKDRVLQGLNDLFESKTEELVEVFRIRSREGEWVWIAANCTVIFRDETGIPILYLGHDQDITEIKRGEQEVTRRLGEIETLRQVIADVNTSLDLNETVSLILEHSQRVIPYDRVAVELLDGNELKIIGCFGFRNPRETLALRFPFPVPGNPATVAIQSRNPVICNNLAKDFPDYVQVDGEVPIRSWLGIPLIANNEVLGLMTLDSVTKDFYTAHHREMAEIFAGHVALAVVKARLFENVQSMALTDHLTGIGNRHSLQLHGPFFLEKAKREQTRLIALILDFDYFKRVNDQFGHDVGDSLLKEAAVVIRGCLRSYDLFIRYGGEEFLVLLPQTNSEDSQVIAERIRLTVASHAFTGLGRPQTLSIGLGSLVPTETMTLSDVIKLADDALYQAKSAGRNCTKTIEL